MILPIALQLYTVRDELEKDFNGSLCTISEIGYRYVEFPGLFGRQPEDIRKVCDNNNLKIISLMTGPEELSSNISTIIKNAETLRSKFVTCAYLPESFRSEAGYKQAAMIFNNAGEELSRHGLTLCYHNHAFEFEKLDTNPVGFEIIFEQTDQKYLKAELDIYWLQYGDRDPLVTMRNFSGRVPLLHIKGMASDKAKNFTEIGTGIIDIKSLIKNAAFCGVQYLIVEQDANWVGSPLESVEVRYLNLSKLIRQ